MQKQTTQEITQISTNSKLKNVLNEVIEKETSTYISEDMQEVQISLTNKQNTNEILSKTNGKALSMVDINAIYIDDSNIRLTLGSLEQMNELKQSIKDNGILQPILIYPLKNSDKGFELGYKYGITHGFRRVHATKELNKNLTEKILRVSAIFGEQLNEEQNILTHITLNNGVSLNALELGKAYSRLRELKGYTIDQIANKLFKANSSVFNSIKLYEQSLESHIIKENLQENKISATEIIKLNNQFNNDNEIIEHVIIKAVEKVKEKNKKNDEKKVISTNIKDDKKIIEKKDKITSKDINEVIKEQELTKNDRNTQILIEEFLGDLSSFINENKAFNSLIKKRNNNFDKMYEKIYESIEKIISK